jgi:hypothetical protein
MIFLSLMALIGFTLAAYGWGRLAFLCAYPGRAPLHAYATGLGVVVLIFIGGVLNAVALATTAGLLVCAYGGILLAMAFLAWSVRTTQWRLKIIREKASAPTLLLLIFAAAAASFLLAEVLPTAIFNYHDDFFSYMVRPIRMQTVGTVGGNPFELIGLSDFGAQSFLQGIFLLWLPLTSITALDTVFCFLLGIFLIAEIGSKNGASVLFVSLAIVVYVMIDPQIVNLSSVYSTAVIILTLLAATSLLLESSTEHASPLSSMMRRSMPVGACLAALIAIKMSGAFFAAAFFIALFGLALVTRLPRTATAAIATAAAATLALLPWMVVHADKLDVTRWHSASAEFLDPRLTFYPSVLEAFYARETIFGATRAVYAVALAVIVVSLLAGLVMLLRKSRVPENLLRTAADAAGIVTYLGLAMTVNHETSLRYAIPFVIALTPTRILYPLNGGSQGRQLRSLAMSTRAVTYSIAVLQLATIVIFAQLMFARLTRIALEHTTLSFPFSPTLAETEAHNLSDEVRSYLRNVQAKTPVGSTVWAWVDAPFQLDFARNRIWHFHNDWLVAPWRIDTSSSAALRRELVERGVDYVLLQYSSDSLPSIGSLRANLQTVMWPEYRIIQGNTLTLLEALRELASPFDIVHDDGTTMLIRLKVSAP